MSILENLIERLQLDATLILIIFGTVAAYGIATQLVSFYVQLASNRAEDRMLKTIETAASAIEKLGPDSAVSLRLHNYIEYELLPVLEQRRQKALARKVRVRVLWGQFAKFIPHRVRIGIGVFLFLSAVYTIAETASMDVTGWQMFELFVVNFIAYSLAVALLVAPVALFVFGLTAIGLFITGEIIIPGIWAFARWRNRKPKSSGTASETESTTADNR